MWGGWRGAPGGGESLKNQSEYYGQVSADGDEAPFACGVCENHSDYTERENANAALITAAPEMLALLKRINEAFYVQGTRRALLPVMSGTKPLIAKAEGR
ncbi:MAG: hypothetical protein ACREFO_12930 [Acetobacteraceae bacterium]